MNHSEYGGGRIDKPAEIVAGQLVTVRLVYIAGSRGIAPGGSLRVYTDSDTDWEIPQFLEPDGPGFFTVTSPQGVRTATKVTGERSLVVTVHGRGLNPGEELVLTYGDRSLGGPGTRAQTFIEAQRFFWIDVAVGPDDTPVTLADPPSLSIVGGEPVRLVVLAPSTIAAGEPFRILLKAEDEWGNATPQLAGPVQLAGEQVDGPSEVELSEFAGACWIEGFSAEATGTRRISAADAGGLQGVSNPIVCESEPREFALQWADPHGGQLVLKEKIGDFYRHARDVAGVQFTGYQRNADAMSADDYRVQQQEERDWHEPGVFVPIPGYEWSGRNWEGGHHNVYFRRHDQPARRNRAVEAMFNAERAESELLDIEAVYKAYRGTDTIITPHVGGEHSNLNHHDPTLEPAVEIVSSHGMFEWMLRDSLTRGYKLGFLGGSDSYTCRPGDDRPGHQTRRYSKAGLTGIYTRDVSLEGFFEAMRARRVYATTGARMVLDCQVDGHAMGSEFSTSTTPHIRGIVEAAGPIESIELFRGLDCIHREPIERPVRPERIRLLWRGSSRMTSYSGVVWDGHLSLSSGRIVHAETRRFDSPRSRLCWDPDDGATWHAWGCGYPMGIVLELDADDAELSIAVGTQTITGPAYGGHGSSPPRRMSFAPADNVSWQVDLRELRERQTMSFGIGVLDRRLELSIDREDGPLAAQFEHIDIAPRPGINPYWMRVVQSDLEHGWTSPVFVDYVSRD